MVLRRPDECATPACPRKATQKGSRPHLCRKCAAPVKEAPPATSKPSKQDRERAARERREERARKAIERAHRAVWRARQAAEKVGVGSDPWERLERDLRSAADGLWLTDYRGYLARRVEELQDRTGSDRDRDLSEVISETCDGSAYIIYNGQAATLLSLSENADAYDNENGESGASVNVRAFYAMEADLRDAITEAGGDPSGQTVAECFPAEEA